MKLEGAPRNKENRTEDSQKQHETAFRFLTNIPEGLEITDGILKTWAREYDEVISFAVPPKEEGKNFYVSYGGKKVKMSKNFSAGSMAYLVYYPNGSVTISEFSMGIEAHPAPRSKKKKKEI